MRFRVVLFTVAALVLVGAGCSSSSGSDAAETTATDEATTSTPGTPPTTVPAEPVPVEDEMAYVDAFVVGLTSGDEANGELVLSQDGAECFAGRWVAIVTPDGFAAAGIDSPQLADSVFDYRRANLTADQGAQSVQAFEDCEVDVTATVTSSLTAGMDEATASCVEANIDPDLVGDLLVSAFTPELDNQAAFEALRDDLAEACQLS